MNQFRTEITPAAIDVEISHQNKLLCVGSCFAEQMGGRLEQFKFPTLINPFGIIYNPISIIDIFEKILSENNFKESDLFENHGLWHSFAHHGRFSHPEKKTTLKQINDALKQARLFLKKADRLILTLGTAHVFIYKKTNLVVANCHKMPSQLFDRRRLPVEEMAIPLISVLKKLKKQMPALEVIATVSPVRHLRDGVIENQRSKAALLLGLEEVCQALPYVHYFPSYEIILDDLRDYRFYEKDLSHPNEMAMDYIWEKFGDVLFNKKTKELNEHILKLKNAAAHRPFHAASDAHQMFLKKQLEEINKLEKEYSELNFNKEREIFSAQLI